MPCDIGYRSVADAELVVPAPETIERRTRAPAVDQELLDRLGVDDPPFLAWLGELDPTPLLERALERTIEAAGELDARIAVGGLVVRGAPGDAARMARFAARWQMEVLRVVCELLDYEVALDERGGLLVIEGEKHGAGGVHEYVSITAGARGGVAIRFEHFASDDALAVEQRRFHALAQKLGIRIRVARDRRAGQPIAPGTIHPHKHRGKA